MKGTEVTGQRSVKHTPVAGSSILMGVQCQGSERICLGKDKEHCVFILAGGGCLTDADRRIVTNKGRKNPSCDPRSCFRSNIPCGAVSPHTPRDCILPSLPSPSNTSASHHRLRPRPGAFAFFHVRLPGQREHTRVLRFSWILFCLCRPPPRCGLCTHRRTRRSTHGKVASRNRLSLA